jgi:outer membrane PBP1 activator LpoA protein
MGYKNPFPFFLFPGGSMPAPRILLRSLVCAALIGGAAVPAHASAPADDDVMFGRALALMQTFVHMAARSADPQTMQKGIDDMLAGRNEEVNRQAASLLGEMSQDLPPEQRAMVAAIARDLVSIARREQARGGAAPAQVERALQARKDLHAMGLRYYDARQFLEAVKRDDALAVELYVLGAGVNLGARDADGKSALEIARAAGNARIVQLLSAAAR